ALSTHMRHGLLGLAILALMACVHAPQRPHESPPAEALSPAPPATPAPAVSPAPESATTDASAASSSVSAASPEAALAEAPSAQSAGLAPALYGDLFDRMRAGFTLEDGAGQHAVDQQLRWYANNPEYLQRAFGRAELYLYQIVTELERRGMPRELALLPVVESAFEPYAYSRARASGLWQFVPGTASRFGLKQDWWYDGR